MAPRLIWFFGPSAAGKKTLIHEIAGDVDHPLRLRLGLGTKLEVCAESLDGDAPRDGLVEAIVERAQSCLPVLVKGQSRDIWDDRPPRLDVPGRLAVRLPSCQQEVVFVWAHPAELRKRCLVRAERAMGGESAAGSSFWANWTEESCKLEHKLQARWVSLLGLPVLRVRSDANHFVIAEEPWTIEW